MRWRFARVYGARLPPNLVGYAQSGLRNGATMVAPQFVNIGASESMPLEALTPTGDDTEGVEIQTLTAAGYTDKFYTWNTWMYAEPCWVDGDLNLVEGVTFDKGTGLWIQGSSTAQGIQAAGKVGTEDVNVQLRNGATATGNPFPVELDLNDILPNGGDDTSVDLDGVEIQTLTAAGYTDKFYTWNTWMYGDPCWVDGDLSPVNGISFAPGQGLWVQGSSAVQYIRFPAPEL